MDVKIENYRGIDIIFVTESERFTFLLDASGWSEKQSYAACKKAIDEHLKLNLNFKPFFVRRKRTGRKFEIIAIRKDNRFVYNNDGEKCQISEYDESDFILYSDSHNGIYEAISELETEIKAKESEVSKLYKQITGETLKDIKSKYIQS